MYGSSLLRRPPDRQVPSQPGSTPAVPSTSPAQSPEPLARVKRAPAVAVRKGVVAYRLFSHSSAIVPAGSSH